MLFIVPLNWCWWTRVWLVRFPNPLGSWGTWPRSDWERSHCWGFLFFRIQEYLSEEGGKGNRSGKNKDSLVLFFINHDYILFLVNKLNFLSHLNFLKALISHHASSYFAFRASLRRRWVENLRKTWWWLKSCGKPGLWWYDDDNQTFCFLFVQTNFQTKTP